MSIKQRRSLQYWLVPLAGIGTLCTFSATFFAYSNAHANHSIAGYTPAIIGLLFFFILMAVLSYLSIPGPRDKLHFVTSIGIALLESAVFGFLFLLLLIKTFGS